jgi:hypothetical protein
MFLFSSYYLLATSVGGAIAQAAVYCAAQLRRKNYRKPIAGGNQNSRVPFP